jgi:hypothetical protein
VVIVPDVPLYFNAPLSTYRYPPPVGLDAGTEELLPSQKFPVLSITNLFPLPG